jgi:hypothetical protein
VTTLQEDFPDGYVVFGLLEPKSNFNLNTAFDRIRDVFFNLPDGGVEPQSSGGNDISIDPENLGLFVVLVDDPKVIEDSRQLAALLGNAPEAAAVARCERRIEFGMQWGDPRGDIFPEFERLLGVLRSFRGVIFLDPRNPAATVGGRFTPPTRKKKK